MTATCETCKFWWRDPRDIAVGLPEGSCRCYPPQWLASHDGDWDFPLITPDKWCGKHKPVEPKPAPAESTLAEIARVLASYEDGETNLYTAVSLIAELVL